MRSLPLSEAEDSVRLAARDMLRLGRYKPTGRGKPASEYLLRAAGEDSFPRISAPVDVCNLISLKHLVPASVWDLDLSGTELRARRGRSGERYVFNASGQEIELEDLILMARDPGDEPMVNPVKDSHATKTHTGTTNAAAVVYFPAAIELDHRAVMDEFAELLATCGDHVDVGAAIHPGTP